MKHVLLILTETIFAQVKKGNTTLNVGVIYRPPNSVFKDFIGELERVIKLVPKNLTFLMCDFNINLFKFASDKEVQSFENLLYQKDYILASPLQRISILLRKEHALTIFYATRLRLFNTLVSYQTKGSRVIPLTNFFSIPP